MNDQALIEDLQARGLLTAQQVLAWQDAAGLLAVLDCIGREGATALVKVDGQRSADLAYTVVISGGRLGGDTFFRKDGADLPMLLREAIGFYQDAVWSKQGGVWR